MLAVAVLIVSCVGVTTAQQKAVEPAKAGMGPCDGNALADHGRSSPARKQVLDLRSEIELLEVEHEAERMYLIDSIKKLRSDDSPASRDAKQREALGQLQQLTAMAAINANPEGLAEFKKKFGDDGAVKAAFAKEFNDELEQARLEIARTKRRFVAQSLELNIKRMQLADLEKP
jgi:hypothetical protein